VKRRRGVGGESRHRRGGCPLSPRTTTPAPSPGEPLPPDRGPAQPFDPSKFGPYPPYIPKTHVDLSHLPESAIEDTHSDQGVVLWKPSVPGELPPHWLSDYRGISPGVWVPLEPRDYVPGQTHLAGG
jgi:hypothetical protein